MESRGRGGRRCEERGRGWRSAGAGAIGGVRRGGAQGGGAWGREAPGNLCGWRERAERAADAGARHPAPSQGRNVGARHHVNGDFPRDGIRLFMRPWICLVMRGDGVSPPGFRFFLRFGGHFRRPTLIFEISNVGAAI